MGRALAADNASDVHVLVVPFLFIMLGPPLVPIWAAGLWSLGRRPEWRELRFVAAAFPVLVVLVLAMGSQFYYPFGLLAVLFAVGCVPAEGWLARRASHWRRTLVVAAVGLNALVSAVLGLPLIPVSDLGATPVPGINQVARDTVGWPAYVRQIADVYRTLPPADRAHAVILASNYGEAGAVDRYGARFRLPPVYSGHNQLFYNGHPPASATVAVFVGGQLDDARGLFASCTVERRLDDGVDVDNEEQGEPVGVCRNPIGGWPTIWPSLQHQG